MTFRLIRQELRLRARALGTHDCDERRLAGNSIFANSFADLVWFAFDIEQVVGNLIREPDVLREIKQVLPDLL